MLRRCHVPRSGNAPHFATSRARAATRAVAVDARCSRVQISLCLGTQPGRCKTARKRGPCGPRQAGRQLWRRTKLGGEGGGLQGRRGEGVREGQRVAQRQQTRRVEVHVEVLLRRHPDLPARQMAERRRPRVHDRPETRFLLCASWVHWPVGTSFITRELEDTSGEDMGTLRTPDTSQMGSDCMNQTKLGHGYIGIVVDRNGPEQ